MNGMLREVSEFAQLYRDIALITHIKILMLKSIGYDETMKEFSVSKKFVTIDISGKKTRRLSN